MKKVLLPAILLATMTSMSSCLFKTYNCKCTTVSTTSGTSVSNESVFGGIFVGKKGAENECKSNESSNTFSTTTCVLE